MAEFLEIFFQKDLADMDTSFWIAQGVGVLVALISIISSQMKRIEIILTCELCVNLLCATTYSLLEGPSAAYICIAASVQAAICFLFKRKNKPVPVWLTCIFIAVFIGISALLYKEPIDILPGICAVAFCLAIVQQKPSRYRIFIGINPLVWTFYDIYKMAYSMLITHIVLVISVIVGIIRNDIKHTKAA